MVSELEKILRQGRNARKLSQDQVAEQAGLSRSEYVKLESGLFVFLENIDLCKIAATVGADPEMLISLYRSEFRSELQQQKNKSQRIYVENSVNKEVYRSGQTAIDNVSLDPDLVEIGREIMTLPDEPQRDLIHTMKILVEAQIYRLHASSAQQSL